jgi:condensin complex subunit 3
MLGKLYITANSDPVKLRTTSELVIEAIDNKVANDAPSRNALNKLHLALSKAMGEAGKAKSSAENPSAPVDDEGLTTVGEQVAEESVLAGEEDVIMETVEGDGVTEAQDSLLEELLTDEEEL